MSAKSIVLFVFVLLGGLPKSFGDELPIEYKLIEGSYLLDDCLICGRPSIQLPMRGSFETRTLEVGPFKTRYGLENIDMKAGGDGNSYWFVGTGWLEIGGDFAITQQAFLEGTIITAFDTNKVYFTNATTRVTRRFPMISVQMVQTNGTLAKTFTLQINAAPFRDIWFSTAAFMDGDVLSMEGRVVKENGELQKPFPGPTFANLGLDSLGLLPGGGLAVSFTNAAGIFNDGDVVMTPQGGIIGYAELLEPLAPIPSDDPGLDAVHFETADRVYFSLKQDIESNDLGTPLQHGDLIWRDLTTREGGVLRKNADLLAAFHPQNPDADYGLDALYIWPSGEIWFSTETSFNDGEGNMISEGDLLSDQGYVVYRNADLLAAFNLSDQTDVGLDALAIIADVGEVPKALSLQISFDSQASIISLDWKGGGRVFQVERADEVSGPYAPVSEIIPDVHWEEPAAIDGVTRFYRVRQW